MSFAKGVFDLRMVKKKAGDKVSFVTKFSNDANEGYYMVSYYCYADRCPGRTKDKPWPTSDGIYKWKTMISKKGNRYRRLRVCCEHCDEEMSGTVSANDFA